jgi:23S rRNA (cytosine1962-C5)-methyltransferase
VDVAFDIDFFSKLNIKPTGSQELKRVIHGRGQCFKGLEPLTLDVIDDLVLGILHQPIAPVSIDALLEVLKLAFPRGLLQDRSARPEIRRWNWGDVSEREIICEAGLNYQLEPFHRQNMGFFPDMSSGRAWLRSCSEHKRVLNLFSYTCSFSVSAAKGGATGVVNVDMSWSALERGRINHELNDCRIKVDYLKLNILKSWGRIQRKGPYDLIICDPPSQQRGSFFWERDYVKVLRRLKMMLNPKGQVLACLNAPKVSRKEFFTMVESVGDWKSFEWLDVADEFENENKDHGLKLLTMSLE